MCESDTLQKYKHLQNANIHQEMNLQKKQSARFLGSNYHNIHFSVYIPRKYQNTFMFVKLDSLLNRGHFEALQMITGQQHA